MLLVKLKAVPETIFENHTDSFQEKASYLAGWKDGSEAQLKKMVAYLKSCKGELVSHNNEPFVCTFEIPTDEWMDILKEVE